MAERLNSPPEDDGPRDRLPTLAEVLGRRTLAPVDLYAFHIYMRDQQRSVDYLDFWLDVSQHLSLCRHYVRELRRSVLVETPITEKAFVGHSPHTSQLLDSFDLVHDNDNNRAGPAGNPFVSATEKQYPPQEQRLSQYLRDSSSTSSRTTGSAAPRHSHKHSNVTQQSQRSRTSTPECPPGAEGGTTRSPYPASANSTTHDSSPRHTIAREDIRASAEKILYTYLLSGSEREIILPHETLLSITTAIEEDQRDDPEVFDVAKDYVFAAMERDAYPGFLRCKALGNLVPAHLILRLVVGLLALFGGFWTAFVLVFLDFARPTRCWLILPFALGVYCLASHQYMLDPLLALAGYSEYTFFNFTAVKEPFVRKLLNKRGWVALWWVIVITAALSCLFIFVPGKRL